MGAVIVAADDSVDAAAPKLVVRVLRNKAALAGFAARDLVETIRMGLEGENVTPIHSGLARHELPVRVSVSPEHQDSLDKLLKLSVRSAGGALVPLSDLVQVVRTERNRVIHHKDLLPVACVVGDMTGALDSPQHAAFQIRSGLAGIEAPGGRGKPPVPGDLHGHRPRRVRIVAGRFVLLSPALGLEASPLYASSC